MKAVALEASFRSTDCYRLLVPTAAPSSASKSVRSVGSTASVCLETHMYV